MMRASVCFCQFLQEKNSIRELMTEEHQLAEQELQCCLKLAEDEQSERLKTVISTIINNCVVNNNITLLL